MSRLSQHALPRLSPTLELDGLLLELERAQAPDSVSLLSGFSGAPGGVGYFSDELFEDVFERDIPCVCAVLVDEPGKV